jgi:uncharacterized SAM-binding protein YcdF (DUF218 family)
MSEAPQGEARRRRRPRRRVVIPLVLVLLVLAAYLLRRPALEAAARVLDVGAEPLPSDFIFLLGGDIHSRPVKVAQLYEEGFAPRVVMARLPDSEATRIGAMPNETDATITMLTRLGVPDSAIVIIEPPTGVSSTTAEAMELRQYLETNPASRLIVVTSAYHTRRARWQIRRQLRDVPVEITMVAVPDPRFDATNWWSSEAGVLAYVQEYLKFVHNWVYGVTGRR